MRRLGGERWKAWEEALRPAVLAQRQDGDPCAYQGSWDPVDPWGKEGGRVYSTAMMALCAEALSDPGRVVGLWPR